MRSVDGGACPRPLRLCLYGRCRCHASQPTGHTAVLSVIVHDITLERPQAAQQQGTDARPPTTALAAGIAAAAAANAASVAGARERTGCGRCARPSACPWTGRGEHAPWHAPPDCCRRELCACMHAACMLTRACRQCQRLLAGPPRCPCRPAADALSTRCTADGLAPRQTASPTAPPPPLDLLPA